MILLLTTNLRTARTAFTAVILALLAPITPSIGNDFYWDASSAQDGNQNGGGIWSGDGNTSFWTTSPSLFDSLFSPWNNDAASVAHLGAASGYTNPSQGGILTLGEAILLNRLVVGPQAGAYTIDGGAGPFALQFDGTDPTLHVESTDLLSIHAAISAFGTLVKSGSGRVLLAAPAGSNSPGALEIREGGVVIGAENTLPTNLNTVLGHESTAGSLEVLHDQTLGALRFSSRNVSAVNQVSISAGSTLTVNGSFVVGIIDGSAIGGNTQAVVNGAGSLVVNNAPGSFIVSSGAKLSGGDDVSGLDLSGLASFTATVNRFDIGRATNEAGSFQGTGRPQATLRLAAQNEITANSLVVGANTVTTNSNFLYLGGSNALNVGTLVAGGARANGTIQFASGLDRPSLILRGATGGDSRANVFLGDSWNASGLVSTGGSSAPVGTMNLSGGIVDLRIDTMRIGLGGTDNGGFAGGAYGRGDGHFTFGGDGSLVDVNVLVIGDTVNSTLVAANSPDPVVTSISSFTMNGGTLLVNDAMILARSLDGIAGNQQSVTSTFHLNGGDAIVNAPIVIGQHTGDGTGILSGTLHLNGGSLTVAGTIARGSALTAGTLNLHGASLDLGGHALGDATNPLILSLQSGRLSNVVEINGGAALVKTGTGTLVLGGTNTFTGALDIENGRLLVASATALQAADGVFVRTGGTLDFVPGSGGTLTLPSASGIALTLENGSSLGAELGNATGSIVVQGGASVFTPASAAIGVNLYRLGTSTPPASSILLNAPGGGITANGAIYSLGAVYNATDFTASLVVTDTQLEVVTTAATALANAYWMGGFGPAPDVWSASNGINAGNWVTNPDGTGATGLVPGAAANVFFSAVGATLPANTRLGADMVFNRLTVGTAAALTVEASGHRLTLLDSAPLTVGAGAGAVVFAADLELDAATATLSIDNAGGFTLGGVLSAPSATHLIKTGSGTLTLSQASLHTARTSILGGTLEIASEAALGSNPAVFAANHLTLDGGTLRATTGFRIDDANRGITLGAGGGTISVVESAVLGIDRVITGNGGLVKTGAGTLEITANATYTGSTSIQGGTLRAAGGNNTLSTGALNFSAGSATLDLGDNSQTVSALTFTAPGSASVIRVTGDGGTLAVTNTGSVTQLTTSDQLNPLTFDLRELGTFNYNGGAQSLRIGLSSGSHSAQGTVAVSTVYLAGENSLTAASLLMGDQVGSSGGGLSTLLLGESNFLNFNAITQASARSSGEIRFQDGLVDPGVTIRASNGTGAVGTWTMGSLDNFTNNVWTSTADFSGGTLDALVTTLNVGRVLNRNGTLNATFAMDRGNLNVTNLNLSVAAGTNTGAPTSVRVANSQFTLAGPGTVNATNIVVASNTSIAGTGTSTANGTVTVRDGVLNVGAGGIVMGRSDVAGHSANATLHLYGGIVSVNGDIREHATGAGSVSSTLELSGATLDLNGNDIGTAARPIDNLILERGVLRNVGEINGGGAVVKSGEGTLILTGTNTYSGATTVSDGILLVNGDQSGASGAVTVGNATTEFASLGGTGTIGGATTVRSGSFLSAGDPAVAGGIGTLNFSGDLTLESGSTWLVDLVQNVDEFSDRIVVGGALDISGSNLNIAFTGDYTYGNEYRIAQYESLSSQFAGLGNDAFFDVGGRQYQINYGSGAAGGYITLTAVPEPGTYALLVALFAGVRFARKRAMRGKAAPAE